MSNLAQYMREALESGQSVYLPVIGTFRKERVPAFFDALKDRFVPPFKNLVLTDEQPAGSSVISLVRSEKNSEKLLRLIEDEIRDLRTELRSGDEVILEGLGRLRQNGEQIEFNATGLGWTDFPDYDEVADAHVLREPIVPDTPLQQSMEEEVPVIIDATTEKKPNRSWAWLIGALLLAGAVFAWFWYSNPDGSPSDRLASPEQKPGQEQIAGPAEPADSLSKADTSLNQEPALAATDSAATEPAGPIASMVREPSGRFEIIIAAFHTMEEATEFVERTNARGYNVYILKNQRPNNLNKVSYASFDTEREVNEAIAKVRKEINPDAWIYKNKVNQ